MAILTGVRADESLNRFMGLVSQRKLRYADDKPWTTASPEGFYYTLYPLYDWKARDIWIYNARTRAIYNPLYDLMYRAGVPLRNMRVCEPFGPEQRKGLWLYHVLEPETWARMCERVSGAASGALYANESGAYFALRKRITKPPHHTWRSYAMFLLDVMPERTAEHYRNKIAVYLRWYQTRGFPDDIPDEQENDLGSRDIPSWRRICKTLIKNDFWCRTLSFSPNKPRHYERYLQRNERRRKSGDSVTPEVEVLSNMIRQYFSQERSEEETIRALNHLRRVLHEVSPFAQEPVDCVLWVKADEVVANDYNPNVMSSSEKKLLKHSLEQDGFTQPVVVSEEKEHYLVVDGFHRQLLGRKADTRKRLKGWLPVTCINPERKGQASRIAATIRHNRARGKHQITSMSDIVRDLSRLGWTDERIGTELGMDQDEVLRLKQISGLTELFQEENFSPSWTVR